MKLLLFFVVVVVFIQGTDAPSCLRACLDAMLLPLSYPNLSEGADSVGGQLRGDNECPFGGVINQFWQTLKEGAEKRCSECVMEAAVHRFCPIMNVSGYIYSCRHRLVPG